MTLPDDETRLPEEAPVETPTPPVEPEAAAPGQPARSRRRPLILLITAGLVLLAAAGGFFWLRGQEDQALARAQDRMAVKDWTAAERDLLAARGVQPAFVQQHGREVTAMLAESYYRQEKYDLAQAELDRALALQPGDADLLGLQTRVYLDQGKLDLAAQAAGQLKASDPDAALPYGVEAWKALRGQKYADALAAAEEALKRDNQNIPALRVRGTIRAFQYDLEGAKGDLDAVIAADPDDIEALAARVFVTSLLNQDMMAAQDLQALVNIAPEHPAALWARAINQNKHHDRKAALELMEKAIQKDATRPEFYLERGSTVGMFSEEPRLFSDLEAALKLNPDFVPALGALTQARFDRYENVDMDAAAQRLLELAPKSGISQTLQALVFMRKNKDEEALKLLDEVVGLNPRSSSAYLQRADVYLALDKVDQALADVNKALELNPDYFSGFVSRAGVYLHDQKIDLALESARKAQKLEPESPTGYLSEGLVLLSKPDVPGARAAVEKALKLDPTNPRVLYFSSTIAGYEGNSRRALDEADLAVKNAPTTPFVYLARSLANLSVQKVDAARQDAKKMTEIEPEIGEGWQMLARVEAAAQNWDAAVSAAQKTVGLNPRDGLAFAILGQGQAVQGKLDQAIPNLKKAVELQPDIYMYALMLAVAQRSAEDYEGAQATLAELMKHKDRLDINLLQQVEQEQETLAGITKVSASENRFQDPGGRFSLKYSSDWTELTPLPAENPNLALVLTRQQSGGDLVGVLMVYTMTAQNSEISAQDLANEVTRVFGENTGYKFSEPQTFKLGEQAGLLQDYDQSVQMPDGTSSKVAGRLYYLASGNRYVWLEFKCSPGDFNRLSVEADAILSTLKIAK